MSEQAASPIVKSADSRTERAMRPRAPLSPLGSIESRKVLRAWLISLFFFGVTLAGSIVIGATNYGPFVIVGVLAAVLAALIVARPELGLYLLIVFVYLNLSDVLKATFGIPSVIRPLVGLMLVSVLANRLLLHRKPFIFRGIEASVATYGFVMLLSSFGAQDRVAAANTVGDWVKDFCILLIIVQLASEERTFKKIQWVVIFSAAFLSILSCYQVLTHSWNNTFYGLANNTVNQIIEGQDSNRISGPLADPNFYAQILLMAVPLAMYRAMTAGTAMKRTIGAICTLLILVAVTFTYSRAAFIAAIIIILMIMRNRQVNIYKVLLITALIVVVVLPFLPPGYIDRIFTLQDILPQDASLQTEKSFRGRFSEQIVAFRMFLDHPVLGVGPSNYQIHYQEYSSRLGLDTRSEERQAHNLYLEVLAEKGFVGLSVYILMLITVFSSFRRAKQQLRSIGRWDLLPWVSAVQYGLASYLFTSLFLHDDYSRYLWLIVAFAAACSVVAEALVREHQEAIEETERDLAFTYA